MSSIILGFLIYIHIISWNTSKVLLNLFNNNLAGSQFFIFSLKESFLKNLQGIPYFMFVNEKGEVIGESIVGAVGKERFVNHIEKILDELE